MKCRALSIAITLAGMTGVAVAGNPGGPQPPVTPFSAGIATCTAPDDSVGHACDAFDHMIRSNFTPYEIGELFGYRSTYPNYEAARDRLEKRYDKLLQRYLAGRHPTTNGARVASTR